MPAPTTERSGVPRRFRRRLLAVLLAAGLAPLVVLGLAAFVFVDRMSTLSLGALDETLERVSADLDRRAAAPDLRAELAEAQLSLAQAEAVRPKLGATVLRLYVGAVVLASVLLAAVAWLLGRRISTRVEMLAAGMARVGAGDLDHRLPVPPKRPDELDALGAGFNRMGDELAAQRRRLAATEKIAAWQDVARAMAHDLKNPLTAMKMALGRLRRPEGPTAEAAEDSLGLIEDEVGVLMRMTESFATFAKLPDPVMGDVDLRTLVEEIAGLYRASSPVAVEVASSEAPTIRGDGDQLRRALGNLVKNAVEASQPGGGAIEVAVRQSGAALTVTVSDRGRGVAEVIEGAALHRGLGSTKAGGSGLGLPIAHKIVHGHGGTLRLVPRPGGGTDAIVELPTPPP